MHTAIQNTPLPAIDESGLLLDPHQWNEAVAIELARKVDIGELSDDHWLIIYALRDYFNRFGFAPAMVNICRDYKKDHLWVHNLFGTCMNAWCVAGLPDPGEEAKSYLSDT
jgi:TusE/DsrC/DsvC family sulfur relay protein